MEENKVEINNEIIGVGISVDNKYTNTICFGCLDTTPIVEIRYDGDILVRGKLIENDIELVEAFKTFFKQQGLYGSY